MSPEKGGCGELKVVTMPKRFVFERVGSALSPRCMLGRMDPLGLAGALAQVGTTHGHHTMPRRLAGLSIEMAKVAVGRSTIAPEPKDWRFENRAWKENPLYHRMCQAYLAWTRTALDLVEDAHFEWRMEERAKLATILLTAAVAPTNLPLLNPDVIERAYETGGGSVVTRPAEHLAGRPAPTRASPARSTGTPCWWVVTWPSPPVPSSSATRCASSCSTRRSTEMVSSHPSRHGAPADQQVLLHGHGPGSELRGVLREAGIPDVRRSAGATRRKSTGTGVSTPTSTPCTKPSQAAAEIAGTDQVNTVSLCAGGITTAALLGHLASTRDALINCATFAVTLLDFTVPTMIGLLASPAIVENSLRSTKRTGVLPGPSATALFSMLRPNDLIWNYWVRNNLMGEEPPTFDVLAWNSDATRLPAALHADFLDLFMQQLAGHRRLLGPWGSRRPEQGRVRLVRRGSTQRPPHRLEGLLRHDPAHGRARASSPCRHRGTSRASSIHPATRG